MSWSMFIPSSMPALGALALVLAVLLVFLDVPGKGVDWEKVAAVLAVVGGFGVGGASAGWFGVLFQNLSGGALSGAGQVTAQLVGVSAVGAVAAAAALWAYSRLRGSGITAATRSKSLLVVAALALVGTVLAGVPRLYPAADAFIAALAASLT
ncbi:hypothetical protein Ae717Ps2_6493c [Pseudonocardia sp. Ae717_Ps2]|uniref:hypothetical protein n=1 Tax=Pseudonocardia sp. Ae717_Ps2 TaxID=1885573 RepID=UPI00094B4F44|nr:hypothetical protein [Pseudonocardia sp. Ae717_Ps2]OLM28386.1 hypothetical protein Ae717Ps2_6445c [Pseudonocardia sp. Ae717_Ps2]OLM28434.1 hypothetical protein Ae717Ps2_6493c [Pseudonocardia sp. Ae717_Ps2]